MKRLGWPNRGIVPRSDITGFNWSNRPVVLTEVGFLTNPGEDRALKTAAVVNRAAAGLRDGVLAYLHARGLRCQDSRNSRGVRLHRLHYGVLFVTYVTT